MPAESRQLEVENIECIRHERTLFSGLSFQAGPGGILQIDGANGSGKTSLLRILCGLLPQESGEIRWSGSPIQDQGSDYTEHLAYVGHKPGIKVELTPMENLRLTHKLIPTRSDADPMAALKTVGLYGYEEVLCGTLSAGQRRRVALARLLLCSADLWILDEPFTALDKMGRDLIADMLVTHSERKGIAILTTHQPISLADKDIKLVHLSE